MNSAGKKMEWKKQTKYENDESVEMDGIQNHFQPVKQTKKEQWKRKHLPRGGSALRSMLENNRYNGKNQNRNNHGQDHHQNHAVSDIHFLDLRIALK